MTDAQALTPAAPGGRRVVPRADGAGAARRPSPPPPPRRWHRPSRPRPCPGSTPRSTATSTRLLKAAPRSPEFAAKATDVRTMGDSDIRQAAETSNRLLKSPVKALQEGGLSEGSKVGSTLLELRRTVEDLDPKEATGAKKLLGMIPFGDRVTDYFRKYQSAEKHLDGILHALREGQDELGKDNAALNLEKQLLWDAMARLNQYVYVAERLDARLAAGIADLEATDPERAKALRDDVLFYVRQKHQDLLTQLAVSIQNYLAIDIVIKNNIELIKGVDRASTTTISALRTAVIVAQALGNQKLVLDQITALNTTTSGMIERTSEMLARQLGADPGAGRLGHRGAAAAAGGLRQHLRHHGRDRHLQGAGARHHGRHDRHPRDRGRPSPAPTSTASSARTSRWPTGRSTSASHRDARPGPALTSLRQGIVGPCRVVSSAASSAAASRSSTLRRVRPCRRATTCSRRSRASRRWSPRAPYPHPSPPAYAGSTGSSATPSRGWPTSAPGSPQAYSVMATATDYLPEAVGGYLRLPRQFADSRPVDRGKSSLMVLIDQLDLLASTMDKVFDAVCRDDAAALVAHGRFLEEKFGPPPPVARSTSGRRGPGLPGRPTPTGRPLQPPAGREA